MAILLIDKIKQKNDGEFFLMDAEDVEYNGASLADTLSGLSGGTAESEIATDDEVTEMLDEIYGASGE